MSKAKIVQSFFLATLFSSVALSFFAPLPVKAQSQGEKMTVCKLPEDSTGLGVRTKPELNDRYLVGTLVNGEIVTATENIQYDRKGMAFRQLISGYWVSNRYLCSKNSEDKRPREERCGDPKAILQCMNGLLYVRKPVCTRVSCSRGDTPEEHANYGTGGWQWQTVRTEISESTAADACRNAK